MGPWEDRAFEQQAAATRATMTSKQSDQNSMEVGIEYPFWASYVPDYENNEKVTNYFILDEEAEIDESGYPRIRRNAVEFSLEGLDQGEVRLTMPIQFEFNNPYEVFAHINGEFHIKGKIKLPGEHL